MSKKFYIPVAIPYVNAPAHIGHAFEYVYADALARFYRGQGHDVFLSMGADEHGQKIAQSAAAQQMQPQEFADMIAEKFKKLLQALSVEPTDFIRTTEERHTRGAQLFWQKSFASGDIEKDVFEGLYCVGCEEYKTEKDLVEGMCPEHRKIPERVREENYFFRLSRYQSRLLEFYEQHPRFVIPESRYTEIRAFVSQGLEDVPISRSKEKLSWGVPVPNDASHVMYVWFDALVNYLTVIGFGDEARARDVAYWWPADMHIVGKGINRFHSVLWVAMLMSAGIEPPQQIGVHGYITAEGQKMSKTIGNVIDPMDCVEKYGVDPVRYFLLAEIPFASDGDFSTERFAVRYESELANGLGNLLSRVTNMIEKYFDGRVQASDHEGWGIEAVREQWAQLMTRLEFHEALALVWREIITRSNVYIEQNKPWELAKTDTEQLRRVLEQLLYALQQLPDFLAPCMPETAENIRASVTAENISKSAPLFPRLEQ